MIEYTVIYEKGETNLEVQENIKEAIALYLEVLQEDGQPIPQPSIQIGKVAVMV